MLRKGGMKLMCTDITQNEFSIYLEYVDWCAGKYAGDVMVLIQEIKRNIIYRRFRRETDGVGITTFNRHRSLAHLSITVQKICNFRKYQGKTFNFFETMQKNIRDILE
jgi:hypothetical protein